MPEGGCTRLFEDVGAGAEEGEEAEVAEDLELQADFVADGSEMAGKRAKTAAFEPKAAAPGPTQR